MGLDEACEARADRSLFTAVDLAAVPLGPGSNRRDDHHASPWLLRFRWAVEALQADALDGNFCARAFAKGIGAGYSGLIGEAHMAAVRGRRDYELGVLVPARALPESGGADDPDQLGMYLITGVVHHIGRGGGSTQGVASVTIHVFLASRPLGAGMWPPSFGVASRYTASRRPIRRISSVVSADGATSS